MPLHRYILDANASWSNAETFSRTLSLLPNSLHSKITSYHFPTDRNLALGSALLQRYIFCLPQLSTSPFRTIGEVPIASSPTSGRPSISPSAAGRSRIKDYNTSHHNPRESSAEREKALVALIASTHGRVGVDVVATRCRPGTETEFLATFDDDATGVFTGAERRRVREEQGVERQVKCLMLYWGLKEAYVKALGTGLGGDLLSVEFHGVGLWDLEGENENEGSERVNVTGYRKWIDKVRIVVDGVDVTEKWWIEITLVPGVATDFYIVVCAERGDQFDDVTERGVRWEEVDYERDILPHGG